MRFAEKLQASILLYCIFQKHMNAEIESYDKSKMNRKIKQSCKNK